MEAGANATPSVTPLSQVYVIAVPVAESIVLSPAQSVVDVALAITVGIVFTVAVMAAVDVA